MQKEHRVAAIGMVLRHAGQVLVVTGPGALRPFAKAWARSMGLMKRRKTTNAVTRKAMAALITRP